ncbi:hypothetical protein B0T13DRAFT_486288 [Neurospora crassa]|nr:hypothetical protein B0T13DRAFT_486288 [Neurospora crassa]
MISGSETGFGLGACCPSQAHPGKKPLGVECCAFLHLVYEGSHDGQTHVRGPLLGWVGKGCYYVSLIYHFVPIVGRPLNLDGVPMAPIHSLTAHTTTLHVPSLPVLILELLRRPRTRVPLAGALAAQTPSSALLLIWVPVLVLICFALPMTHPPSPSRPLHATGYYRMPIPMLGVLRAGVFKLMASQPRSPASAGSPFKLKHSETPIPRIEKLCRRSRSFPGARDRTGQYLADHSAADHSVSHHVNKVNTTQPGPPPCTVQVIMADQFLVEAHRWTLAQHSITDEQESWVMLTRDGQIQKLPGEKILLTSKPRVGLELSVPKELQVAEPFSVKSDNGIAYITNERIIYLPARSTETFRSFFAPPLNFSDVRINSSWIGPWSWTAIVRPIPNGGVPPEIPRIECKLTFKDGGHSDFQAKYEWLRDRLLHAQSLGLTPGQNLEPPPPYDEAQASRPSSSTPASGPSGDVTSDRNQVPQPGPDEPPPDYTA